MKRVQLCLRCGRPVTRPGYCDDCQALRQKFLDFDQKCTFCGKTVLQSPLYFNKRLKHTYCENCKALFVAQLLKKGIPKEHVDKILKRDFIPVSPGKTTNL